MVRTCNNCVYHQYNGIRLECLQTGKKYYQYTDESLKWRAGLCRYYDSFTGKKNFVLNIDIEELDVQIEDLLTSDMPEQSKAGLHGLLGVIYDQCVN